MRLFTLFLVFFAFAARAKDLEHYSCVGDGKKNHQVDMLTNPAGSDHDFTFFLDGERLVNKNDFTISYSLPGSHAGDLELFLAKHRNGDWVKVDQLFCFESRSNAR